MPRKKAETKPKPEHDPAKVDFDAFGPEPLEPVRLADKHVTEQVGDTE